MQTILKHTNLQIKSNSWKRYPNVLLEDMIRRWNIKECLIVNGLIVSVVLASYPGLVLMTLILSSCLQSARNVRCQSAAGFLARGILAYVNESQMYQISVSAIGGYPRWIHRNLYWNGIDSRLNASARLRAMIERQTSGSRSLLPTSLESYFNVTCSCI